jgi:predicted dehydrogenase
MSQRKVVRLGVVGVGNIAQQHIANIRSSQVSDCVISALCARQPTALAAELNVPQFHDYNDLVASGLCDAILVATPTFTHFEIGACALRAGLHVMMEKPIGLSVQEGDALLALQQPGQVFALMLNQRTDPLFTTMRDVLARGTLGAITRTHWTMTNWFRPEIYFQVSDWRATWRGEGGGLLLNQCIHNLDIFQWLCGMPIALQAFCGFGRYHSIEVEDEVTAWLRYANGATGVFVGSTGEAPGMNRFDIVGDKGALCFDGERLRLTTNEPGTLEYSSTTRDMFGMPVATTQDITPERTLNQHVAIMANFTAAILRDEPLLAPAAAGLNSLALANAMLLSTWEHRVIELPLDAARYQQQLAQRIAHSQLRDKAALPVNIDISASYR